MSINPDADFDDEELDAYKRGYLSALQDVADGCWQTIGEMRDQTLVPDEESREESHTASESIDESEDVCPDCGSELRQEMGSDDYLCLKCRME